MRPGTPDLATERERQLTTARANQTTGLTNGRAANWAPEVALVLSARFPVFLHILKVFFMHSLLNSGDKSISADRLTATCVIMF